MNTTAKILIYGGSLALLFLVSLKNYLLFHSLAELFSIVIAFGIFVIGWNSRKYYKNNYLLFIGIAYLFVAFFDTLHMLAYKGMNIFEGFDDNNLPPQLWLVARYMESVALLLAPTFFGKPVKHWRIISVLTVISVLAIYAIFFAGIFPACFVTGSGLTPFKVVSEYLIDLILCAALYQLYRNREHFEPNVLRLLILSIVCTMVTELCFTVYVHLYGISNLIGHFFKIFSFWFMYKAVIETALGKPYDLLFRELRMNEERFASAFNFAPIGIALVAPNGGWLKVNRAICAIVGYTEEELLSKTFQDITHPDDLAADLEQVHQMLGGAITSYQMEKRYFHKNGSIIWALLSVSLVKDGDGNPLHFVSQIIDITDRKTVEVVQTFLSGRGWISSDEAFFPALARFLADILSLEYICIDRLIGDGHVARTLAVYHDGKFEDNIEYALKNTPCGEVVGKSICCFPRNVSDLFPNDPVLREINAQSYIGITLWGKDEKPIGLIALIGKQPFANQALVETVLQYVAPRATGELERVLADEALRESEARFRSYYELGLIGMAITSLEKGWVQYNDCLCVMFGYSREELAEKSWTEMTHPDDLATDEAQFIRVLQGEINSYTLDKRFIRKDGKTVQTALSVKCVRNQDGAPLHFVAMIQDITERKQAEIKLREANDFLSLAQQSANVGLWHWDMATNNLRWSPELFSMFGLDPGKSEPAFDVWQNVIHPDDRQLAESRIYDAIRDHIDLTNEYRTVLPSGEVRWIYALGRTVYDDLGKACIMSGVCLDITDRKRAEEQAKSLQLQLHQAQKMEAIGVLAGGIAHDFNNILGAILGYAEMVQEDSPAGSIARRDIDQVVKASHRAKDLVKQILAFSRQAVTDHIPLQPGVIIKEALKMLRSSLPSTINIQQDIDPEAGLILADPTHIHQIMVNLCTNAFHAMEETGGILTISLEKTTLSTKDLMSEPQVHPGDFVKLSIGDTGAGISPEIQEKMFDPFFTTKEVGKGTGMGLAIIHGIVKSYKGFVTCQSQPGEGTVFDVYLPIIADPVLLKVETVPLDLTQLGHERILFIDDEEILAEMGKDMLERLGYRVTVRRNSIEALNTFQNQPGQFDLVITDQTMPGMTGSDLARRMLQIRPGMPIILCTGYSSFMSEGKAKLLGIKGFAMKPLARNDLAALIRKVLDGGRPLSLELSQ